MTRKASMILSAGVLVFLAACGDTSTPVMPEGTPRFDGGLLAGSGNRSGDGVGPTSTTTTGDTVTARGGLLAGSGN